MCIVGVVKTSFPLSSPASFFFLQSFAQTASPAIYAIHGMFPAYTACIPNEIENIY